ncbi:hypothetical protein FSP39_005435 [Pinctada imbricata]|uniref:Sulfotransferase domain-containing protein n=1 Tax=Pinctada imbricata TaxID=66713 RepID=A0AA88YBL7_PINIB|nr:hypothetical protein FSP39_005435 [Pinctada imbricata]
MSVTSDQASLIVGKETIKDGDFQFSIETVNGVGMFPFPSTIGSPQRYADIITDVINFESRHDDVILATYPKCVQLYGTWFDYERDMTKGKSENKNILTVHFENLKMDPVTEVRRIADFLEVDISDEVVNEISAKCKFQTLKKANDDLKKPPEELLKNFLSLSKILPNIKVPAIYRKGEVGDWKNHFTVAQNERFDAWFSEEMMTIDQKVISEIMKKP